MGWMHSPPYFCTFTETATDIANAALRCRPYPTLPPHHLASLQKYCVPCKPQFHPDVLHLATLNCHQDPLAYADIYIDDFISLSQPIMAKQMLCTILHSIDAIFRSTPLPNNKPTWKQIISASKLALGDGAWSTSKVVLGWQLDTAQGTMSLPKHREERLHQLLSYFGPKHRTSHWKWYGLLGELRHMSVALHGARYLFSILQSVLVQQPAV
jgi:hypothetical protein